MISIKFDGTNVNPDSVMAINRSHNLFMDSFHLGSTASAIYNIELSKQFNPPLNVSKCTLYENGVLFATLVIDSINTEDETKVKYKFTDGMVNFNFEYSAEALINQMGGTCTLLDIMVEICDIANISLATTTFDYHDMEINWYDDRFTGRDYVGFVAELNGGYSYINKNGELEIKSFSSMSKVAIPVENCSSFKVGEEHNITRMVYDNGIGTMLEVGVEGETVYIDSNNPFINGTDDEILDILTTILTKLNNFKFYGIEVKDMPIPDVKVGEIITFNLGDEAYPVIWGYKQIYNTMWLGGYSFKANSIMQEETKVIDETTRSINSIRTEINRQSGTVSIIAEQQNEMEDKLVHLQVRAIESDVIITNQKTENPSGYASFKEDGMRIYVQNTNIAEATADRFNCNKGLGIQDWAIVQGQSPSVLNVFRKE